MHNFSFVLEDYSNNLTKVIFTEQDKDLVQYLLESYEFDIVENNNLSFFINKNIKDVFEELTEYELEDSKVLLTEDEDGFYITPSDDVFEIESIITTGDIHLDLIEAAPKRTQVIRGGKRKIIFKCGPGQMKIGRVCRRRPTAQLNKMKRRAKMVARKSKSKRGRALRKRKISMRRRAILVKKKPQPHKK